MCGNGLCRHNPAFHALRWFIALIALVIVFCLGVKIGEVKGLIEGSMHHRSSYGQSYRSGHSRMMAAMPMGMSSSSDAQASMPVQAGASQNQ
jgi:hypothetical protein